MLDLANNIALFNSMLLTVMVVSLFFFVKNILDLIERFFDSRAKARILNANWHDFEDALDAYLKDYECLGETGMGVEGAYTPNAGERYLIKDAVLGFMSEPHTMDVMKSIIKVKEAPL